jgi:hypothetical protein
MRPVRTLRPETPALQRHRALRLAVEHRPVESTPLPFVVRSGRSEAVQEQELSPASSFPPDDDGQDMGALARDR